MAGNIDPLARNASFTNQQLPGLTNARSTKPTPAATRGLGQSALEVMGNTQADLSGLDTIKQRSSKQHQMYLQAVRNQQARQRAAADRSGVALVGGGGSGGGGYRKGQWGLLAGADNALGAMNAAFRQRFGYDIPINDGSRTREEQAYLYNLYLQGRGNLAAPPGSSLHESGRALDLGGAFQNAGSAEHQWLQQNAWQWGWQWTGKNFSQFEPWHWEWRG